MRMGLEEWPDFSERDKELIREVWDLLDVDKTGFGVDIYRMIFDQVSSYFRRFCNSTVIFE